MFRSISLVGSNVTAMEVVLGLLWISLQQHIAISAHVLIEFGSIERKCKRLCFVICFDHSILFEDKINGNVKSDIND